MWKDKAIKLFIGASGLAIGALFVFTLHGAAQLSAERLHASQTRAKTFAVAMNDESRTEIRTLKAHAQVEAE
jgi:hypothetical protein